MPTKGGQGGTMGKLEGNGVMTNAYIRAWELYRNTGLELRNTGMHRMKRTSIHLIINRPESDDGQVIILLLRQQEYVRSAIGTEIPFERNAALCIGALEAA